MTDSTLHFIIAGVLLGVSAGFSPGPLSTLIISQTIAHNRKEGIKVAISPLMTDLPIILIALLIYNSISKFDLILAVLSFVGGAYLAYLGIESLRIKGLNIDMKGSKSKSIKKG